MKTNTIFLCILLCCLFSAKNGAAAELKLFVNEPQGGRCTKNIADALQALKEVHNVKLIITPKNLSGPNDPQAPAVAVDDELLAENGSLQNGRIQKDELIAALLEHGAVPASAGYSIINAARLKAMLERHGKETAVFDARNPEEYQEVHIPQALNLPAKKFDQYKHLLPRDTSRQLVFYCNGVKCGKSRKAAEAAVKLGYSNVLVFSEGMPVWEEMNYPVIAGPEYDKKIETTKIAVTELKKIIDNHDSNVTIVDVRDNDEFAEGHIPGAINIPVARFASRSAVLAKEKKIIVYCNAGSRSYLAYRKLIKLGYKNVFQVMFADWKENGMAVDKS